MDYRRIGLAKWLNLAHCLIRRNAAIVEGAVERRLQNGE